MEGGGYYYETFLDYIHLNPVRAGLVRRLEGGTLLDFPWSSGVGGHILPPTKRARWLAAPEGLRGFECPDSVAGRRRWLERLKRRAIDEEGEKCGKRGHP